MTLAIASEPQRDTAPQEPTALPALEPKLGTRLALGWNHVLATGFFAAFFVYLSYVPLFHTDIWGHVHYGHWILENRTLPQEDPFMPLTSGMRVVDNAWLSQVTFAGLDRLAGREALSVLFAVTVLATFLVYFRVFLRLTRAVGLALGACGLLFFMSFSRHAIIRPEIFGGLFFAALWWMLLSVEPWRNRTEREIRDDADLNERSWPAWLWIATPLMFVLWANMHGSFAVGLVVLGCHVAGHALTVLWRERKLFNLFQDRTFRRWVWLTELALVATLINPYGLDLLIETARFGKNPNLRDVLEWFPMKLVDLEGIQFSVSLIVMMFALRFSRLRFHAVDALLLLVFAVAVAPTIRMISWYAPVFTLVMTPHLADMYRRMRGLRRGQEPTPAQLAQRRMEDGAMPFAPTLICLLIVWTAFSFSPLSRPVLGGKPRSAEQLYSHHTPLQMTEFLQERTPTGLVFAPQWWGDWVSLHGPPELKLFMTTNLHLAPRQVWRDYLRVARGQTGWPRVLEKYHVTTLIVHKELQPDLARGVRRATDWEVIYEDDEALVLERKDTL